MKAGKACAHALRFTLRDIHISCIRRYVSTDIVYSKLHLRFGILADGVLVLALAWLLASLPQQPLAGQQGRLLEHSMTGNKCCKCFERFVAVLLAPSRR